VRPAVPYGDVLLPALPASARVKVEVIGDHRHVAEYIGNISSDADGGV
jgi:hypothetical protein